MTHEYVIGVGGWIQPSIDRPGEVPSTAIAWAADRVLAVGPDDAVRAISRGDSTFLDLAGAVVTALPSDPERALALVSELAPEQAASRLAELLIEAGCLGADGALESGSRADLAFWRIPPLGAYDHSPRSISLIGVVRAGEFTQGHPRQGPFAPPGQE